MEVIEAQNLMKKDIGVLGTGKSDPYCILRLGAQKFQTKTINNTVNPKWNFCCEVRLGRVKLGMSTTLLRILCGVPHYIEVLLYYIIQRGPCITATC